MDAIVKELIAGRKDVFYKYYDINDEELKNDIENLFVKINELGETCLGFNDFETKFASSELNTEYNKLLTDVSMKCPSKINPGVGETKLVTPDMVVNNMQDDAKELLDDVTHPARVQANQKLYDMARDVPGLGAAMEASQYASFINRFKKNNNDDEQ